MGVDMIKYSSFILVFISAFTVSCAEMPKKGEVAEVIDYENNIGWLHGSCLAIKNKNLSKGVLIKIVHLNEPQNTSIATVSNKAKYNKNCFPLLEDRRTINIDSGYSFYLVKSDLNINLGIAIVGSVMNIDKYTFDYCTTTEGVLYSLKKTGQNNGKNLWSGYYYLGYDSEATCDIESNE